MWQKKISLCLFALFLPAFSWAQEQPQLSASRQLERDVETAIANLKSVSANEARMMEDLNLIERSYLDLKNDETIMIEYYEARLNEYKTQLMKMTGQYSRLARRSQRSRTSSVISTTGWIITTILLIVFIII